MLRKLFLVTLLVGYIGQAYGQEEFPMPMEEGEIVYEEVVQAEGQDRKALWDKVKNFVRSNQDVSRLEVEQEYMKWRHASSFLFGSGVAKHPMPVNFAVTVMLKDGRYKYEITEVKIGGSNDPAEGMTSKKFRKNKRTKDFPDQTHQTILDFIRSLKAAMQKEAVMEGEDDW